MTRWLDRVEGALREGRGQREVLDAGRDHAVGEGEALAGTLAALQRRLLRLAVRLP